MFAALFQQQSFLTENINPCTVVDTIRDFPRDLNIPYFLLQGSMAVKTVSFTVKSSISQHDTCV